MTRVLVKEMKEILDPNARHLFLDDRGSIEALSIMGVEKEAVVTEPFGARVQTGRRKGYFIASSGRGIVRFEGSLELVSRALLNVDRDLYHLKINLDSLELSDRRRSSRYRLVHPLDLSLQFEDDLLKGQLIDLSEGGLRLSVARKLPSQGSFQLEVKLPATENSEMIKFKTDGLIVYCEPEEDPSAYIAGVMFVSPVAGDLSRYLKDNPTLFTAVAIN